MTHQSNTSYLRSRGVTKSKWPTQACTIPLCVSNPMSEVAMVDSPPSPEQYVSDFHGLKGSSVRHTGMSTFNISSLASYHASISLAEQAFGSCQERWVKLKLWRVYQQCSADVKAVYPSKMAPTSLLNTQISFYKHLYAVDVTMDESIQHCCWYGASLGGPLCNTSKMYVRQVRLASHESETTQKHIHLTNMITMVVKPLAPSSGVDLMNPCRLRGGWPCACLFQCRHQSDLIDSLN